MTYLPKSGYADPELPFPVDAPAELIAPPTWATAVVRLDPRGDGRQPRSPCPPLSRSRRGSP
jgi:hypothetical protein